MMTLILSQSRQMPCPHTHTSPWSGSEHPTQFSSAGPLRVSESDGGWREVTHKKPGNSQTMTTLPAAAHENWTWERPGTSYVLIHSEVDKSHVMRLGGGIPNDLLHGINIFSVYFSSFDVKQVWVFQNISSKLRGVVPRTQTKLEWAQRDYFDIFPPALSATIFHSNPLWATLSTLWS